MCELYTDDSICEENNYCGKAIDAPIKCKRCENKLERWCQAWWVGCRLQSNYLKADEEWKDVFSRCPLPSEPIRCASCGTVLNYNEPTPHASSTVSFTEASLHCRIMALEAENEKLKEEKEHFKSELRIKNQTLWKNNFAVENGRVYRLYENMPVGSQGCIPLIYLIQLTKDEMNQIISSLKADTFVTDFERYKIEDLLAKLQSMVVEK